MEINQLVNKLMVVNIFQRCTAFAAKSGAVNLAQGVPEPIMEAKVNEALQDSLSVGWQYANPLGLDSLRQALASEYKDKFNPEQVMVTSGCTESLYLGVFAAAELYGNKIAFLEPFYPYYIGLAELLGMESYPVTMKLNNNGMEPDWDRVESVFKSGVKIFILNTPHNPSGWVMNLMEARLLMVLAEKYAVLLIVDEAYRNYSYNVEDSNSAIEMLYNDNENIILVGSASKLLSVTGLRLGWMLANKKILDVAYSVHLYTTYCHPAPLQQLVATILNNRSDNWFCAITKHYKRKMDTLHHALTAAGFICAPAAGGHFLLADYSAIDEAKESEEFAQFYALKHGVMPLPASPFYIRTPKQVRFSFSVSMEQIEKAIVLIAN